MTFRKPFGRKAALAGMAAVALAGCPVLAASGPANSIVLPGHPSEACANSIPSVQQLAIIDNASDARFQCLGVVLDGDAVKAIRLETHSFASAARHKETEQIKVEEFSRAELEGSRGAVLDGVPGHDAIILRGHFSIPPGRTELVLTFLFNGFTGEYHSCRITLDHSPDIGWRLVDRLDRTISHIVVRTRGLPMIGTFGIATLEGACV
jgi:hypothetical protein